MGVEESDVNGLVKNGEFHVLWNMAAVHDFANEKNELVQRLMAVNNQAFFAQLRTMLDEFLAEEQNFKLTEADKEAIAEGRADVAASRVESLDEFRKHFAKYEV